MGLGSPVSNTMASSISPTRYSHPTTEQRTLRGAIVFLALLAFVLLAIAYPGLAGATLLGGVAAHVAGVGTRRRCERR